MATREAILEAVREYERRRAQWRRYDASAKGRERVARYRNTARGIFSRAQSAINMSMKRHSRALSALVGYEKEKRA